MVFGALSSSCAYVPGNANTVWTWPNCTLEISTAAESPIFNNRSGWNFQAVSGNPAIPVNGARMLRPVRACRRRSMSKSLPTVRTGYEPRPHRCAGVVSGCEDGGASIQVFDWFARRRRSESRRRSHGRSRSMGSGEAAGDVLHAELALAVRPRPIPVDVGSAPGRARLRKEIGYRDLAGGLHTRPLQLGRSSSSAARQLAAASPVRSCASIRRRTSSQSEVTACPASNMVHRRSISAAHASSTPISGSWSRLSIKRAAISARSSSGSARTSWRIL